MHAPAPTNLITGFLGVGKTTAIRHLLSEARPTDQRWAVLVNEFGDVGVDATRLEDGAAIEELPGGCLCCTLGAPFRIALARLLRRSRPARLLIEPTGLGHPARILDLLREFEQQGAITLRATLTLVDPRQLDDPRVAGHDAFRDQAQLADVLIAHKTDLCSASERAAFNSWAHTLYPPKQRIEEAAHGRIDPAWLDEPAGRAGTLDTGAPAPHRAAEHHHGAGRAAPEPGQPVRAEQSGGAVPACGWIFHSEDVFDRHALLQVLESLRDCQRVKGVMRTGRDWLRVDADGDGVRAEATAWRGESRLEVIGPAADTSWAGTEQALLAAYRGTGH
ncbi:CobW family GTP-binding protein [Halorhodospira halophila]|uniref:Cobalamin synthesis protein, P47K n=1 Tax=Halorhodospira halophila (strain DSM 244 / SL1) TaxID=349124 RepID=A1WY17_HALHL|nr:GTP-binding protein [Halorhodospira halophila]ABM62579.1 cobalamin synthesis protein, P47K [Halorhodospira halophila SL1]MBK1728258.1 GTP-binding protein [Halorhodospira halophila]